MGIRFKDAPPVSAERPTHIGAMYRDKQGRVVVLGLAGKAIRFARGSGVGRVRDLIEVLTSMDCQGVVDDVGQYTPVEIGFELTLTQE